MHINTLATDTLICIVLYLEPCDLILWRQVCRLWYQLGHSEVVMTKTMALKNPFIGDGQTWQDCFLAEQALTSIYPGAEKYLDLYRCLARAIHRNHLPAVYYFLKRVTTDTLASSEFATLLDRTSNITIFNLLLDKLMLCHPEVDKKQFIGDKKSTKRIKRAPLIEQGYDKKNSARDTLCAGYKFALVGLNRKKIRKDEWSFSREIRFLCRQLPSEIVP